MQIGAHVTTKSGPISGVAEAERLGAEVGQIFVGSPRTWAHKVKEPDEGMKLQQAIAVSPVVEAMVVHANYLINLASSDEALFSKSRTLLLQTLTSASNLRCGSVVLHTGSHRGLGYLAVRDQVIGALDEAVSLLDAHATPTKLLLENTAGAGGTVGGSLEELADLLQGVDRPDRLGVCLDTQHLFAFGYDLRDPFVREDLAAASNSLFGGVDAVHCNDSKTELGSNHDRHANLGEGAIGEEALAELLSLDAFEGTDVILEVPGDGDGPRQRDVAQLRGLLGLPAPG